MASTESRITTDIAEQEIKLMKKRSKAKSNFALSKNRLFQLIEDQDLPSRREIICVCQKMDLSLETLINALDHLADFYLDNQQVEKGMQIVRQMDQLDAEYCSVYETVRYYMNSRYNDFSNAKSSGRLQSMGITKVSESYYGKKDTFSQEPDTRVVSTIEQDLWKQLKRVQYICLVATKGITRAGRLHFWHV